MGPTTTKAKEQQSLGGNDGEMAGNKFNINGLLVYTPLKFADERGSFCESFNERDFEKLTGIKDGFVQDNESHSVKHVLRGLHFQVPPHQQGKLVRVVSGSVLDVAVDLRSGSSSYGKHATVELSAENGKVFWIPPGFAHGFLALQDNTIFQYKCTGFYNKDAERTLAWNDPDLAIDWEVNKPLISEKDSFGVSFREFKSPF